MSNDKLPKEIHTHIVTDAANEYPLTDGNDMETGKRIGYIAGATAWAEWKVKYDELLESFTKLFKSNSELTSEYERLHKQAQRMADDVSRVRDIIKGLTAAETHRFPTLQYLDNELEKTLQQFKDGGKEVARPERNVSIGEHITYCHDCGFPVDECNCIENNNPTK